MRNLGLFLGLFFLGACGSTRPAIVQPPIPDRVGAQGGETKQAGALPPADSPGVGHRWSNSPMTGSAASEGDHRAPASRSPMREEAASSERQAGRSESAERPGLGTVFGERRTSRVERQSFARLGAAPWRQLAVLYNDAAGVAAQLAYLQREVSAHPGAAMLAAQGVLVGLRDAWGRALTGHAAADRLYVAGQEGQRYSLWIRNETSQRFEVVASVDGLDVINGRSASLDNRGYLLEPGGELVIDGFRLSDQEVAAFRFGRVSDSYAARTGSDRQVGLIGLAFFAERDPVWTPEEIRRRETADPFPADQRYAFPPPQ